jgi:ribosomal protein L37E
MLMADTAPRFSNCPRCGSGSYETLETHSHCVQCNFSEERSLEAIASDTKYLKEAMDALAVTDAARVSTSLPKKGDDNAA